MSNDPALAYDDYFRRYDPGKYNRYLETLEQKVGRGYTLSPVPLFLEPELIQRLTEISDSLLRFLSSAAYQKEVEAVPWPLAQPAMTQRDYFGCADYYLTDRGPKLLEINMGPSGRIALVELMEERFCHHFGYDRARTTSRGFDEGMVRAMTDDFALTRIAIAVSHLASSSKHLTCYRYLEEILQRFGVRGKVIYANELRCDGTEIVHREERFDGICNLLIPFVWEKNLAAFAAFHLLFQRHHRRFFPNPSGARLATKALLTACSAAHDPAYGLAKEDVANIKAALLPAARVSDYTSAGDLLEAFGGEDQLVLKPLKEYGADGVLIKPERTIIARVMETQADNYIAQAYCQAQTRPFLTAGGKRTERMALIRLFFTDGRYSGMRGYLQEDHCNEFYVAPILTA